MGRRGVVVLAATGLALVPATGASADGLPGGCRAFGQQDVAALATGLGPVFGATASGVASSAPGAFPALVVGPEQARFCP